MDFAQRSAADGEILAECGHQPALDNAGPGHHTIAREGFVLHPEVMAIMLGVHSPLAEGAGLEQRSEAIACRHEALLAAGFILIFTATAQRGGTAFLKLL
ncbi:hypothetical protein SDC9_196810 [bioreactor metagenome]|uniref:Uncharacterized protein n=1 Tax=bioreactor metagenome TaxID=1076179 RepID=A0A645ID19_9ZZZZ